MPILKFGGATSGTGGNDQNTVLLLHSDEPDNCTTFIDSGVGAYCPHTIATQGTPTHKSTKYAIGTASSIYLNGTTSYLTSPNHDDWNFGSSDFTIDLWVNFTTIPFYHYYGHGNMTYGMWGNGYAASIGAGFNWMFISQTENTIAFVWPDGTINTATMPSGQWTASTWYHVAAIRNGNVLRLFINGLLIGSFDVTGKSTGSTAYNLKIGHGIYGNPDTEVYLNGHISEYRISKGIARWTSNFVPPSAMYYSSLVCTNTKFLLQSETTNGSTTFIDTGQGLNSPRVVTPTSVTHSTTQAKFGSSSVYFSGSSSYLQCGSSIDFDLLSDFTVDAWVYPTSMPSIGRIFSRGLVTTNEGSWCFGYGTSWHGYTELNFAARIGSNTKNFYSGQLTITLNTWHHMAVVRSHGAVLFFLDGVHVGGGSYSTALPSTSINFYAGIQTGTSEYLVGYVEEARLSNIARWTPDFTPPSTTYDVPTDANTVFLLQSETTNGSTTFTDTGSGTASPHAITATGSVAHSTSQARFGASSIYFNGSTYLSCASSTDFDLPGDFTFDVWAYATSIPSCGRLFARGNLGTDGDWCYGFGTTWNGYTQINFAVRTGGGIVDYLSTQVSIPLNTWHHFALVRKGNAIIFFLNGTAVGCAAQSASLSSTGLFYVGARLSGGSITEYFPGYLEELRFSNVARWYTNFTLSTEPYLLGIIPANVDCGTTLYTAYNYSPDITNIAYVHTTDAATAPNTDPYTVSNNDLTITVGIQNFTYVKIDFGNDNKRKVSKLRLYLPNSFARTNILSAKFAGSDNDSSWTDLCNLSGVSTIASYPGWCEITFTNTTDYRYYKVYNAPANNNSVLIEWEMLELQSTDFVPTDIPGCLVWLRAESITGLSDGDELATWIDDSGNSYNALQTTPANRPLYKEGQLQGQPVVRFNGSSAYMDLSALVALSNCSIFIALKNITPWTYNSGTQIALTRNTTTSGYGTVGFGGNATAFFTNEVLYWYHWDGSYVRGVAYCSTTSSVNGENLFSYILSGTTESIRLNRADLTLSEAGSGGGGLNATTYPPTNIGRIGAGPALSNFLNADIAEILVYNSALSNSDRDRIENYLVSKYKTPLSISGCSLWLDATQITGLNIGDAIENWLDTSGNQNSVTQSDASKRPTYEISTFNDKPVVRFDGIDNKMTGAFSSGLTDMTVFVVGYAHDWNNGNYPTRPQCFFLGFPTDNIDYGVAFNLGATTNPRPCIYESGTATFNYFEGTSLQNARFYNLTYWRSGGNAYYNRVDGVDSTSNPKTVAYSATPTTFYIAAAGPTADLDTFHGDIAEIIVYNRALTITEIEEIEAYLNVKWIPNIESPDLGMFLYTEAGAADIINCPMSLQTYASSLEDSKLYLESATFETEDMSVPLLVTTGAFEHLDVEFTLLGEVLDNFSMELAAALKDFSDTRTFLYTAGYALEDTKTSFLAVGEDILNAKLSLDTKLAEATDLRTSLFCTKKAYYVRSTTGSDSNNGSSWALAKQTITGALNVASAGEIIYVSQAHNYTTTSAISYPAKGTANAPVSIICVNDSSFPPTQKATTAVETTTFSTAGGIGITFPTAYNYWYGITFRTSRHMNLPKNCVSVFDSCTLSLTETAATDYVWNLDIASNQGSIHLQFINTAFSAASANAFLSIFNSYDYGGYNDVWTCNVTMDFKKCVLAGVPIYSFFRIGTSNLYVNLAADGCDFSNIGATGWLIANNGSLANGSRFHFKNCKLSSLENFDDAITSIAAPDIVLENCYTNTVTALSERHQYQGQMKTSTTVYRASGAKSTVNFSWCLRSNSRSTIHLPLQSINMTVWCTYVDVQCMATVEFVHDSIGNLGSADFWAELEYQSSGSSPIAGFVESKGGTYLLTTNAVSYAIDSQVVWTAPGFSNPKQQKFELLFTPQMQGLVRIKMYLARPNYTVYVDPKITITAVS
jgi:hypothetical protein